MSIATDMRVAALERAAAEQAMRVEALEEELKALRALVESKGKPRA
jgi:predicted RNase H-like nuclease (RuvC/YqgF family)